MSQRCVEQVIGRLVTDERFRCRFAADRGAVLAELAAEGAEFNRCEREALAALDPAWLQRFADDLDPRIQKIDLKGGKP